MSSRLSSMYGRSARRPLARANSTNLEGRPSFERSSEECYVQTLLSNTFGRTFYVPQKGMIGQAVKLHNQMVQQDPEFVAKALAYARNKGYMRSQPVFGLAVMATFRGGTEADRAKRGALVESIFDQVIRTPNDLFDFLSVCEGLGSQVAGRRMRRVIRNWLDTKMTEYWAIKYGSDGKDGWTLRRVIRRFHPRHRELYRYLRSKKDGFEVSLEDLPQVAAFEALKRAETAEDKVKYITEGRLPHEVATSFAGKDKDVWNAIAPQLPVFALVRNLATLERQGVLDQNQELISAKLGDPEVIRKSKMFPFRFLRAAEMVRSAWAADALRGALELSYDNIPDIQGTTSVFCDISGSMQSVTGGGRNSQVRGVGDGVQLVRVAAIAGIALMKKTNLTGPMLLFDTRLEEFRVSKFDSILSQAQRIHARGGTDTSLPMMYLLQQGKKVDNIIMFTDQQENSGSGFYNVLAQYRRKVNPNVKVFIVDISPYNRGGLVDPNDQGTYYIYGWSDQVLQFISMASKGWKSMTEAIRKGAA